MRNQFLLIALTNCQMFAFAQGPAGSRSRATSEGHRLHGEGRYAGAETAFRTAPREAELQEHTENIATSLSDLSLPLEATGQFTEAESVLLRAAALWKKLGRGRRDEHPSSPSIST